MTNSVLIDTYKGFNIYFDKGGKYFWCALDAPEKYYKVQRYVECQRAIEDFIDANIKFVPFKVRHRKYYNDVYTVRGMNNAGETFVVLDKDGKPIPMYKRDEDFYILETKEDSLTYKEIDAMELQKIEIDAKIKELHAGIKTETLTQIRKNLQRFNNLIQ